LVINCHRYITVAELWRPEVVRRLENFQVFEVLSKNDPFRGSFHNSVPKEFIAAPIDVLCLNFVKFGRREIGKIVRCLPDKKFRLALQLSLLRGSRPKFARTMRPRECTQSAQDFVQIGSLSAKLFPNA